MTGKEVRNKFLEYFKGQDHRLVPSALLIPRNDPTLLFTNAGMVQFKDVFLGAEKREYNRAVSSQKCVRAGGKHNDLEMVGRTARHHTFFEMLGNFSFGDYFKKGAVEMAWEFLTTVIKLPEEKLWATIFKDDDEAYDIWHKGIKLPQQRIMRLDEKSNFWSMGETGPCGPCSEIIIDQGDSTGCGKPSCSPECECGRYLELWNLVFMQFDRDKEGKMTPLPRPSIDTGMGLERLSATVQGKFSNFDCDLIRPIIASLEDEFTKEYGEDEKDDISLRVIADHVRASTFLISDGVMPSNEGRGYVVRRIIRRALRHGKILGKEEPFLYRMMGAVVDNMKDAYPELIDRSEYVSGILLSEEESFESTLRYGLQLLEEIIKKTKKENAGEIPGREIFILYDTYGFPLDIAEEAARDAGLRLDIKGYTKAMEAQKETARASWKGSGERNAKQIYKEIVGKAHETQFTGYASLKEDVEVLYIIKGDSEADFAAKGEDAELIFNRTPFYGESGGQIGDTGKAWNKRAQMDIINTVRPVPGLFVHSCRISEGKIKKGEKITVHVTEERRRDIVCNHSATHLLHAALRQVLGDHVKQSGSLVGAERLRFDYTHFSQINPRESDRIEEIVNEKIRENFSIITEELAFDEAVKRGAMALFGEKYGERVRMVRMGSFSAELCGGTHAAATGDMGIFKITNETGVASGIRRIEAVTGKKAYRYIKKEEETLAEIRLLMKAKPQEESVKVRKMAEHTKRLEKEIEQIKQKMVNAQGDDITTQVKKISGISVLTVQLDGFDVKALRSFIDNAKNRMKSGVVVVGTAADKKVFLAAGVTKDLTDRFHAGNILKEIAGIVGGSGGGRPDMAQAGGKDPSKLKEALERVYEIVKVAADMKII